MIRSLFQSIVLLSTLASPGFAGIESIAEPATLWSKKSISVCWGSAKHSDQTDQAKFLDYAMEASIPFESTLKNRIQKLVTSEFTLDKTGIEFTGWGECEEFATSDVIIFSNDERLVFEKKHLYMDPFNPFVGSASIGENGTPHTENTSVTYGKSPTQAKSYVYLRALLSPYKKVDTDTGTSITALHEFGHLAGLRHEHIRKEAHSDVNCSLTQTSLKEEQGDSLKFYGKYDPVSIMNYCYMNILKDVVGTGSRKIELSKGDLHTIRCLYKPEIEKGCGEE